MPYRDSRLTRLLEESLGTSFKEAFQTARRRQLPHHRAGRLFAESAAEWRDDELLALRGAGEEDREHGAEAGREAIWQASGWHQHQSVSFGISCQQQVPIGLAARMRLDICTSRRG